MHHLDLCYQHYNIIDHPITIVVSVFERNKLANWLHLIVVTLINDSIFQMDLALL